MPETIPVAPLGEALTFARVEADRRLIAVTSCVEDRVGGVDISHLAARAGEDAIDIVNRLGYDGLKREIEQSRLHVNVAVGNLGILIDLTDAHIAVGTNYRDHAEEATVKGGPFLFPKIVTPRHPRGRRSPRATHCSTMKPSFAS